MELKDYLNVIRRRARLIVACGLVVMVTTVVFTIQQTPTYRARAEVLISQQNVGAALLGLSQLSPDRDLQTQANLMRMRPLLEKAIVDKHLSTTPEALLARTKVTAIPETNLIQIEVVDTVGARAAPTANAIADTYVVWSRDLKRSSIRAAGDEVERRLAEKAKEIQSISSRSVTATGAEAHQAEIDTAIAGYTELAHQLEQLRVNEQLEVGPGSVVSRAVHAQEVAPSPFFNGALALVVGLLLGVGVAFLAEYLDNTIKSVEDVEKFYDVPLLGQVPLGILKKGEKRSLSVVEHPGSQTAESYRVLRNGLDFVNFEHAVKTLLVTSAVAEEGKSTVAANLAAIVSQAGKKTVLLECDFRRPIIHEFFDVNQHVGLSDVLTGAADVRNALQRPQGLANLWVLSAGRMPPNPSELLGSATMQRLIDSLSEWADWIIVDTPPLLAVADAAAVARWVDGVLLVTAAGSTTRELARDSQEMLRSVGARLVGVVMWGLKEGATARSSYYSYYSPPQAD